MILVNVDLVILDVNRKPMKGFPIETKYVGGKNKRQLFSDQNGKITATVSPHRDFEIHVLTTNNTFALNVILNSDKAKSLCQKIVLPNPMSAYLAQSEMSVIDLDQKPVSNAKFKQVYKGSTILDKKVGVDGKIILKTIIGEPITITMLRPDSSEIPHPYTFTASRMKMLFTMKLSMHQNETNTAPNQPTSNPSPITPPQQGHISLVEAHKIACRITGYNEGARGSDPNAQYKTLAGDADHMGMSLGILQWNFGKDTLAPLLNKMRQQNSQAFNSSFTNQTDLTELANALDSGNIQEQMRWARRMQTHQNHAEWHSIFNKLGDIPAFQQIQLDATLNYQHSTISDIKWLQHCLPTLFTSVPLYMYCALFDQCTQQGGIAVKVGPPGHKVEVNKAALIAEWAVHPPLSARDALIAAIKGRSEHAIHIYASDCFSRRLTIVNGHTTSATLYGITKTRENPYASLATNTLVDGIL